MARRSKRPVQARSAGEDEGASELESFLHPEMAFHDPFDVVHHPDLNIREKRAILARWVAQICAAEAAFGLCRVPQGRAERVVFDDVMDALRALEWEVSEFAGKARPEPVNPQPQGSFRKAVGTIH